MRGAPMDKGLEDYLDASVDAADSAEWITPWCYKNDDFDLLVDHIWIVDRDATVCTNCSVNLVDWKRAMSR